jgi:hypothetical protein
MRAACRIKKKLRAFFTTLDKEDGQQRRRKRPATDGVEHYGCCVDKLPLQQEVNNVRHILLYKAWADRGHVTTAYSK